MKVYNFDTQEQIGADITHTGGDNAGTYLWIGHVSGPAPTANQNYVYHNMVIDSTDYTFPLLGWETGGGGSIVVEPSLQEDVAELQTPTVTAIQSIFDVRRHVKMIF